MSNLSVNKTFTIYFLLLKVYYLFHYNRSNTINTQTYIFQFFIGTIYWRRIMWSMTSLYLVVGMMFVKVFVAAVDFKYPHYPAVFNFGDSNSDTGGLVSELGKQLNPPYGNTHFGQPEGRFCDGRLVIDFFSNYYTYMHINYSFDCYSIYGLNPNLNTKEKKMFFF